MSLSPLKAPSDEAELIAWARQKVPAAFTRPLSERLRRAALWLTGTGLVIWCLIDFNMTPMRLWDGMRRFGDVLSFMFPPYIWKSWEEFSAILYALLETVSMGFLGTAIAAIIALPVSLLGAKNINRMKWPHFFARRGFDLLRSFETIILALIFIRAFGLGPLAGVLAIAFSDLGSFAKLFSEAIENTSKREVDGVIASGASHSQAVRFGVLPQVMPVILSIVLYNFESNVRSSTILGIVGAGGIGYILSNRIQIYRWDEVWSIIFLIVFMVYAIDWLSGRVRARLIGR